jgi:predicted nuclease with TOPRIM domain
MKQDLQIQVERIRRARETASSEMTLARIRIAEQLRRSEEDLSRQIESLERFREQMADQKGETDQAVVRMQKDWKQFIQQAFSDLDSQLRETNGLITQMEALRDRFDVDPDDLPLPTKEQIMTPSAPQPVTPTPTVTQTPPANPEPATTTPTVTAATPTSTGST